MKNVMIAVLVMLVGIPGVFVVSGAQNAYQDWGWMLNIPVVLGVILFGKMKSKTQGY